ncbi:MAG: alpha-ketoglutarate-dependent dioxygenase AlkB [Tahibacter sp.]
MSPLDLFSENPGILFDDASGRVEFHAACVAPARAREWFDVLQSEIQWRSERRLMYAREVDVPRLVASHALDDAQLPAVLTAASAVVRELTGVAFSHVGLNLYRDGRDSVAPHNDHLDELALDQPIALLSLGATRRMTIRRKQSPPRVLQLDLHAGSLLLMSYATQLHYTHAIPKVDYPVGARISLAFRVRRVPAAPIARGHYR